MGCAGRETKNAGKRDLLRQAFFREARAQAHNEPGSVGEVGG
jgi:hypothetical protein